MKSAHLPDDDRNTGEGGAADWLRRSLREPELLLAELILVFVVVISALQITLRYVFNAPLEWPEELSGVLVIWLTFLGAITLVRRGQHARVELLEFAGDTWLKRTLYGLWDICTVVFLVAVIAVVPIASAVMIWLCARKAWEGVAALRRDRRQ